MLYWWAGSCIAIQGGVRFVEHSHIFVRVDPWRYGYTKWADLCITKKEMEVHLSDTGRFPYSVDPCI